MYVRMGEWIDGWMDGWYILFLSIYFNLFAANEHEIDLWHHAFYSDVHVPKKKYRIFPCCLCIRCARYAHKLMVFIKYAET